MQTHVFIGHFRSREHHGFPSAASVRENAGTRIFMDRAGRRWNARPKGRGALVGKAAQRRNCELVLVREVLRWRDDVARLVPGRLADLDRLIGEAARDPKALPRKEP